MVLSMTGFGRAEGIFKEKKILVEIKSLNSKSLDLNMRLPIRYKEKEFEIRKILNEKAIRGKIDCYIGTEYLGETSNTCINIPVVRSYMEQLKEISPNAEDYEYLKLAIKMPEALDAKTSEINDEESVFLLKLVEDAIIRFLDFRTVEGGVLSDELERYLKHIEHLISLVGTYEEERILTIKDRYKNALQEFENIDETRFYQEMAYHTEKLDVSEEKVRLSQHLKYYLEVMKKEDSNGKKLGFIAQEIGREINTLGSKANHHEIQKLVVMMKDDLEKIKEQTLNVL